LAIRCRACQSLGTGHEMAQWTLTSCNCHGTAEEQRFFSQRNYVFAACGIHYCEHVSVPKGCCNGPDLYISTDDRNKMGFAALFANKGIQMQSNVGGRLFSSSYIDKLAKALMGVLHGSSSVALVSKKK